MLGSYRKLFKDSKSVEPISVSIGGLSIDIRNPNRSFPDFVAKVRGDKKDSSSTGPSFAEMLQAALDEDDSKNQFDVKNTSHLPKIFGRIAQDPYRFSQTFDKVNAKWVASEYEKHAMITKKPKQREFGKG